MRKFSTMVCLAALSVSMGTTAQAAKLEIFSPPVQANFGWGFIAVENGTQLQPGNSAMAQEGGSGQIVYEDGCADPVNVGNVVVVQEQSPCAAGASGGFSLKPGIGDWALFTLPGAAIIGGLIFLFNDDDDDRAASP